MSGITILEPWRQGRDDLEQGHLSRGVRALAITMIVLGTLALLTEVTLIILGFTGVIPATSFSAQAFAWGSLRSLALGGSGIALIALGASLLGFRRLYNYKAANRAEKEWAKSEKAKNNGSVFTVKDLPPNGDHVTWKKAGKRVLVISLGGEGHNGGSGHDTARSAVVDALDNDYFTSTIYPGDEVVGIGWYDWCMKKGNHKLLKALVSLQPYSEKLGVYKKFHAQVKEKILTFKPQLIVSVEPINSIVYLAAVYGIPYIIVPTDYISDHFLHGITTLGEQFRVALPLDDPQEIKKLKEKYSFKEQHITITGYPLRTAFQEESEEEVSQRAQKLKVDNGIQKEDKTIIVSLGSTAGPNLMEYCKLIRNASFDDLSGNLHVFVMCGKFPKTLQDMQREFRENSNSKVIFHMQGWTADATEMAAYLKLSDVYVTKPGGGSTSEGWAMGTYLYFDGETAASTRWESENMAKAQEKGVGSVVRKGQFIEGLKDILQAAGKREEVPFPGRSFKTNFKKLVDELTSP